MREVGTRERESVSAKDREREGTYTQNVRERRSDVERNERNGRDGGREKEMRCAMEWGRG